MYWPFGSFLLLPALPHVSIPAVPVMKPAMEKQVTLLAGNLEADVAEACSRNNGLLAFAADDSCPEFHKSPPGYAAPPCRMARQILLDSEVQFVRKPRTRRTLRPADSSRAQIRYAATQFLLVVAEEVVVRAIRHENLLSHVSEHQATSPGSRTAVGVKALDESSFG